MSEPTKWHLRVARPEDLNFVAASWYENYFKGGECLVKARADYTDTVAPIINNLISEATVHVAFAPAYPDEILGYIVFQGPTLHFVYVRHAFRRWGVMKSLTHPFTFTHHTFLTRTGKKILKSQYNPFLLFKG
jgi:hypothetical protein